MFAGMLSLLSGLYQFEAYHYIGFGSYLFDDFKLIHNTLHINRMTSLEADKKVYMRANFNRPLSCIEILNQKSTTFLNGYSRPDENIIIWLDFVEPSTIGNQFADYCAVLRMATPGDVVKITLNANPQSLYTGKSGEKEEEIRVNRLDTLKQRASQYFPGTGISPKQMSLGEYPYALLSCLKKAAMDELVENKYDKRFLFPLCCNVYADGQQMLTFTGIILDDHNLKQDIKDKLEKSGIHNCSWDKLNVIKVPPLTDKELLTINELLPVSHTNGIGELFKVFSFVFQNESDALDYSNYYKYYPNYRHVSF
jgi:hypothetical protein